MFSVSGLETILNCWSGNKSVYTEKWRQIQSLTASLTGKTVDLDHVSLIRGLMDAWGSLRYSWFVPLLLRMACKLDYIHYISTIYSATWGVI